jgi:diketogulonate reductase-like aldo/keto reductase
MTTDAIPTTTLPSGEAIPVLGQGTWQMGERNRREEIAALQSGIDLGMTVLDTAEMYGDGAAEKLIAEAIAGRRDEVFLVSKVLPSNATRHRMVASCERSLRNLNTDRLDLYLLHWRQRNSLAEVVEIFRELVEAGKIRHWGVSNFDLADMEELLGGGGERVATNQVLYNLQSRGIEYDLLPWCRARGIPVMAYSPIGQGSLARHTAVRELAQRHQATPAQVVLAWVLRQAGVIAIPKAATREHVRENRAALNIKLNDTDLGMLDRLFAPPAGPRALETI